VNVDYFAVHSGMYTDCKEHSLMAKLQVGSTPSNQTTSLHSKHTVTWTLMVVGGQCSNADRTNLLTFFSTGVTINKVSEL